MKARVAELLGVCVWGLALGVAGCSSSSDAQSSGAAGAGSSAGAGASGGGDAGSRFPAQAGIKLNLGPVGGQPGTACPSGATSYDLPSPPPSEINPGASLVDGEGGAVVACSVTGTGTGPFKFRASIHGNTAIGDPVTFTLSDGSVDSTGSGSATVSVFTPQLAGTFTSAMPCQVAVISDQVKGGSMWAEFSCAEISSPPSAACASNGYFVLENCEGS